MTPVQWLEAPGEKPARFPSPFDDVAPHTLAQRCAELVMAALRGGELAPGVSTKSLYRDEGGKMFGVLVVEDAAGRVGFLKAFSGQYERRWAVEGFVPPVFDVALREAVEPPAEVVVKELTARSVAARSAPALLAAREGLAELDVRHARERAELKRLHTERKRARDAVRNSLSPEERAGVRGAADQHHTSRRAPLHSPTRPSPDASHRPLPTGEVGLAEQSRADDRERRAQQARFREERDAALATLKPLERHLAALDRLRPLVSLIAMRRIWDSYVLRNFAGEAAPLRSFFEIDPPSGAGDCAAPKLLMHALRLGLKPLALAEFWWGAPPPAGARVEGMYFPACREKCAPILPFMLRGLDAAPRVTWKPLAHGASDLPIVFAHERFIAVNKPAGMLSVPAKDATVTDSMLARVRAVHPHAMAVHRLDLDTSGLLLFALDADAYRSLQRLFMTRAMHKQYVAILDGEPRGDEGTISLPLRVDLDQRPRQLVDFEHGREAVTQWKVLARENGRARVAFFPLTGRTHQLRVHAAHRDGLGVPILGDRLYGHPAERLFLHSELLRFSAPLPMGEGVFELRCPAPF